MSQTRLCASTSKPYGFYQAVGVSELLAAMEGLYVHIASKLEAIRSGQEGSKTYKALDSQELKSLALWRAVFAEFLAQILFVFLVCASAQFIEKDAPSAAVIKIAFVSGLAIMAMIQMIGHVSGGHINPAVTIAMAVALNISIVRTVFYVIAQIIGAIIGGFLLKGLVPHQDLPNATLGATTVNQSLTPGQGLGVEIILTFVLVIVIFGTTDPNRPSFGSPSLLIGLTVTLLHLVGIKFTGASMNPSRSLGSAVASQIFTHHWIYWVGPMLGGILAAAVYKLIINPYRGAPSMEDAVQKMLQNEDVVVIPRDYFKDGKRKDIELARL